MNFIDLLSSVFSQTMLLLKTKWFLNFHKLFNQSKFSFVGFFFYKTSQIIFYKASQTDNIGVLWKFAIFSGYSFPSIKTIVNYLGYPLEFLNYLDNAPTSFWAVLLPNTNFPTFVMAPLRNLFLLLYLNQRNKRKKK